jgi:hypothetical protein
MSLSQLQIIDKIEVLENGIVQVRQRNDIIDASQNNAVIASNFTRWVLHPGDSTVGQDPKVIAITNTVWTPEVVSVFQTHMSNVSNKNSGT